MGWATRSREVDRLLLDRGWKLGPGGLRCMRRDAMLFDSDRSGTGKVD